MKSQSQKQGLVWGGLLILFGVLALLETFTELSAWVWVGILTAGGMGVYALYTMERSEKWLLIISYSMEAVALLVTLLTLDVLKDPFIATYVLVAIALPFLVAFLQSDPKKWGLLIPAYILVAVSVMVPLTENEVLDEMLVAAYVLFAVAIPFIAVYLRDKKQWWALIPGGITAVIGLSFLIAEDSSQYIAPAVLIVAGGWVLIRQFTQTEK